MNFLFLATFFRGLEAEKSWERVRLKIVIIIIGRKRGRAERERERLAVEPTLETLIIKDHPYYKPLCLMMIITKPQKKQKWPKIIFFGAIIKNYFSFRESNGQR